jgi:hypothetical protein
MVGNGSLFIESPRFPVDAVNDYWEMVFWLLIRGEWVVFLWC